MATLKDAITAIKSGDKVRGRQILERIIEANPNNEKAWLWLTKTVNTPEKQKEYLEQVLEINPDHETAQQALALVNKRLAQRRSPPPKAANQLPIPMPWLLGVLGLIACVVLTALVGTAAYVFWPDNIYKKAISPAQVQARLESRGFVFSQPKANSDDPDKTNVPGLSPLGSLASYSHKNGQVTELGMVLLVDTEENKKASIDAVVIMIETIAPNWGGTRDWVIESLNKKTEMSEIVQNDYKFSISTAFINLFVATSDLSANPNAVIPTSTSTSAPTSTPDPTPGPSPTPIIYEWEGEGDDVIFFDVPAVGPGLMNAWYGGDGNFAITLYRADGEYIDLLVNTIDEYEGKITYRVQTPGQYYLEIEASGQDYKPKWYILMAPPQ